MNAAERLNWSSRAWPVVTQFHPRPHPDEGQNRSVYGDHAGDGCCPPSLRTAGVDPFAGRTDAGLQYQLSAIAS